MKNGRLSFRGAARARASVIQAAPSPDDADLQPPDLPPAGASPRDLLSGP